MAFGEPSSILLGLRAIYTCPFVLASSEIEILNDECFIKSYLTGESNKNKLKIVNTVNFTDRMFG